MINRFYIKDFAIIKKLALPVKDGLTVITGETGAGKSILLKSLGIALGAKADKTDVRSGQEQSVVEVELNTNGRGDIYRRLIGKSGRTRSFVNDEPLAEKSFRELVVPLADFHGQHEQQYIMNAATHVDFLDSFCGSENLVQKIGVVYSDLSQAISKLEKAIASQKDASNRTELLQFQIQEIQSVDPQIDEDINLGKEFRQLNHVDELIATIQNLNQSLTENDHSIYRQLSSSLKELERLEKYDGGISPFIGSIETAALSIQDASTGMIEHVESIDIDKNHLQEIEERLHVIESLKRKYGGSIESVRSFIEESENELAHLSSLEKNISDLELEKFHLINRFQTIADELNQNRIKFSKKISMEIESEMAQLNMASAKFQVQFNYVEDDYSVIRFEDKPVKYGPKGYDKIEFYLSANPGEMPKPLAKVASGGEVSRIMLAIKSVLKKSDPVETLIFDEIDSGISGEAAEKVADALEKLSKNKQVICITHLPQIACRAKHHLYIHKELMSGHTVVIAKYLESEEKVQAIAKLFSGESITSEGITSAQQFMDQARG